MVGVELVDTDIGLKDGALAVVTLTGLGVVDLVNRGLGLVAKVVGRLGVAEVPLVRAALVVVEYLLRAVFKNVKGVVRFGPCCPCSFL